MAYTFLLGLGQLSYTIWFQSETLLTKFPKLLDFKYVQVT